jgi:hypothetical protein
MDLMQEIAALPPWQSALVLVALPTIVVLCGPLVIRRLFVIDDVMANNEVAGFKFATLGVVYAVILGLAVISVWEKFAEAEVAASARPVPLRLCTACSAGWGFRSRHRSEPHSRATQRLRWRMIGRRWKMAEKAPRRWMHSICSMARCWQYRLRMSEVQSCSKACSPSST